MYRNGLAFVATLSACVEVKAQPLSLSFRGTVNLGASAVDQKGQTFVVAGLSGVGHRGGNEFVAVMDNSNKLVRIAVQHGPNGSINSAAILGGISLDTTRDFEGLAVDGSTVLLSEESTPAVLRFDLATGTRLATYAAPAVCAAMRPNRGFESLSLRMDAPGFWTANEEALTVDGALSTPSAGTVVRLIRYGISDGKLVPGPHFAYLTQPWHGGSITEARNGLADLLSLPNGRVLALERSFAFSLAGLFLSRISLIDVSLATDVSASAGLIGQTYTAATKTLLYEGGQQNLEGLALGPQLGEGRYSVLGIVDDGDPISVNRVVAFELSGVAFCTANCDLSAGTPVLTSNDFQCFLNRFAEGDSRANCDQSTGTPALTSNDFQCFINAFAAGCP